jgi:hypothetical protein
VKEEKKKKKRRRRRRRKRKKRSREVRGGERTERKVGELQNGVINIVALVGH